MAPEAVQIQSLTDLAERLFAKPPALQVSQGDIDRWGPRGDVSAPGEEGGDHVVMFQLHDPGEGGDHVVMF